MKRLTHILSIVYCFLALGFSQSEQPGIRKVNLDTDHRFSGDKQYQVIETECEKPLTVRVVFQDKPIANVEVFYSVVHVPKSAKGYRLSPSSGRTDNEGYASVRFTTGSKDGDYIISAKILSQHPDNSETVFTIHARKSNWVFLLVMGLLGGLGLFLFGMETMSNGLKRTAGNRMRYILEKLTSNRVIGMFVGAFVTMVIQSSSATTVMLVGFVHAGLMHFAHAIGVILGANIGTTVTAQLIAFKITDYALIMVAVGVGLTMFSSREVYRHIGSVIFGFGLLFFGMHLMSKAMVPLRSYEPFIDLLVKLENPVLGLLIGAIFTALIQSSSAFTGIVIVLAVQGVLTLDAGIPLILGANVGTCVTAGLASINATRNGKRVALAHVGINIGGVLLFLFWIPYFADLVRWISPSSELIGAAKLAAETPRQIANAHTIFNVGTALIFLPLVNQFSNMVYRLLPVREEIVDKGLEPRLYHLDDEMIATPAIAINLVMAEISTIVRLLRSMITSIIEPFTGDPNQTDPSHPDLSLLEGIHMREEKIDFLEEKVSDYLVLLSRQTLDYEQAQEVFGLMSVVNDMENIGDIVEERLLPLAQTYMNGETKFSEEGKAELLAYHLVVVKQVSRLGSFFSKFKRKRIVKIIRKDAKYADMERDFRSMHMKRVQKEKKESVVTHDMHMEVMDMLRQINGYISSIARTLMTVIPEEDVKQENGISQ